MLISSGTIGFFSSSLAANSATNASITTLVAISDSVSSSSMGSFISDIFVFNRDSFGFGRWLWNEHN